MASIVLVLPRRHTLVEQVVADVGRFSWLESVPVVLNITKRRAKRPDASLREVTAADLMIATTPELEEHLYEFRWGLGAN